MSILFKDFVNPSKQEITEWAFSEDYAPTQDWELCICDDAEDVQFLIDLMKDSKCLKKSFFLATLYVFVGDIVRQHLLSAKKELGEVIELQQLLPILETARSSEDQDILLWAERSLKLIEYPESYEYSYWGLGSKFVCGE